jgi:glutaredoxin
MFGRPLLAACLLAAAAAAGAQYKWTDAEGRVHYGDNPPRDAKKIEKLGMPAPDAADPLRGVPYELRRAIENFPVTLYTAPDCGPCDAGRSLLRARGVPYTERTVVSNEDIEQLRKVSGSNVLPVLTVGRQTQQQFETNTWHALLDSAGYPRTSRLPTGWQPPAPQPLTKPAAKAESPAPAQPTN